MDTDFQELYGAAKQVLGEIKFGQERNAGTVAAALKTRNGKIYTGICLHLCCGIGTCAEHAAILEMLKSRETVIKKMIAITSSEILSPCGRCRELLVQIDSSNLETLIMIGTSEVTTLRELLPNSWLQRLKA
jgi:cytidine deaminase